MEPEGYSVAILVVHMVLFFFGARNRGPQHGARGLFRRYTSCPYGTFAYGIHINISEICVYLGGRERERARANEREREYVINSISLVGYC
jgi:hypothetical protein